MNGAVKNRMKSVWFLRSSLTSCSVHRYFFNAKTKPLSSQRIDVFCRTNRFILMRYFITKCTNVSKLTEFLLLQSLISFLLYHSPLPHVALFVVVYDTFQTFQFKKNNLFSVFKTEGVFTCYMTPPHITSVLVTPLHSETTYIIC